jgi:hypothetical protein
MPGFVPHYLQNAKLMDLAQGCELVFDHHRENTFVLLNQAMPLLTFFVHFSNKEKLKK